MAEIKCKYEVCTCAVPHELCPHPLGRASEEETKALAERLCGPFDGHSDGFSMEVAREALRWRDETRPVQAPPAAVPAGYDEDEIADACIMAEVSDSKYEAIITYLGDNRRRAAALAERAEVGP